MELQVEEVGPLLKYATATVKKFARGGMGGEPPHPGDARSTSKGWGQNAGQDTSWPTVDGGYTEDEPPF